MEAWNIHTTSDIRYHVLKGEGHFYIGNNDTKSGVNELAGIIINGIEETIHILHLEQHYSLIEMSLL